LGFTPHPYGEYPSSPLSPFLRGSEGLRLVHAGGGSAGAPLPGLEQRGPRDAHPRALQGSSDSLEPEPGEAARLLAASSGDVSGSSPVLASGANSCLLLLSLPFWDAAIWQWEEEQHPLCWCAQTRAWAHVCSQGTLLVCLVLSPAPASLPKSLLSPSRGFAAHSVSLKRGLMWCSPALCCPCATQGPRSACPWPGVLCASPQHAQPKFWGTRV